MDGEDATRSAHKTVELVEAMAFRALELPSGQRADFVTHHIARLRALKQFPDRFLDRPMDTSAYALPRLRLRVEACSGQRESKDFQRTKRRPRKQHPGDCARAWAS